MFQLNEKPTFFIIGLPIGTLGVEEVQLLVSKTRIVPPLDGDIGVDIIIDGMGVLMLGILTKGKEDTVSIPQMQTPNETRKEFVSPMALMDDKVDITRVPPITLIDGIEFSCTLDERHGPNMV
jgi:hypothetical protein